MKKDRDPHGFLRRIVDLEARLKGRGPNGAAGQGSWTAQLGATLTTTDTMDHKILSWVPGVDTMESAFFTLVARFDSADSNTNHYGGWAFAASLYRHYNGTDDVTTLLNINTIWAHAPGVGGFSYLIDGDPATPHIVTTFSVIVTPSFSNATDWWIVGRRMLA